MRGTWLGLVLSGMALAPAAWAGEDDKAAPAAEQSVADQSAAVAEAPKEFTPPDGWKPKKRGQFTVYCRKDFNVKGTRMPAETCFDEAGIRAMLAAQQEDREKVDQMRKVYGITTF